LAIEAIASGGPSVATTTVTVGRPSAAEFIRFLLLGGIAALANLVARYFLNFLMPFEAAVILAYLVGMLVAFLLFQKTMFVAGAFKPRSVPRFIWVNMLGAGLAWGVSTVMARQILPAIGWEWRPFEVAHFAGVATPAISSYFLHKYYTFA
jgi:putative flippase GtrA